MVILSLKYILNLYVDSHIWKLLPKGCSIYIGSMGSLRLLSQDTSQPRRVTSAIGRYPLSTYQVP